MCVCFNISLQLNTSEIRRYLRYIMMNTSLTGQEYNRY